MIKECGLSGGFLDSIMVGLSLTCVCQFRREAAICPATKGNPEKPALTFELADEPALVAPLRGSPD